ncbi:hypothetical protein KAR48_21175 [bacterium]|nr:hypothetical protein [bacterium]
MLTVIISLVTVFLTILTRFLIGRWSWGYWLGGFIFGVFNEFCFEFCWTYNPIMGPMIWRDVPFLILLAWGSMALLALSISDLIQKRFGCRFQWFCDLMFFGVIGYAAERLLYFRGCWQYSFSLHELWFVQIIFYLMAGLFITSTGRRLDRICSGR